MKNLILAIIICLSMIANAGTFYIDDANGNDSNTGLTPAQAWKTFNSVWDSLSENSTVYIYPGTYTVGATDTLFNNQYVTKWIGVGESPVVSSTFLKMHIWNQTFHNIKFVSSGYANAIEWNTYQGGVLDSSNYTSTFSNCTIETRGRIYASSQPAFSNLTLNLIDNVVYNPTSTNRARFELLFSVAGGKTGTINVLRNTIEIDKVGRDGSALFVFLFGSNGSDNTITINLQENIMIGGESSTGTLGNIISITSSEFAGFNESKNVFYSPSGSALTNIISDGTAISETSIWGDPGLNDFRYINNLRSPANVIGAGRKTKEPLETK